MSIEIRKEVLQLLDILQKEQIRAVFTVNVPQDQYGSTVTIIPWDDDEYEETMEIVYSIFDKEALSNAEHHTRPYYNSWYWKDIELMVEVTTSYKQRYLQFAK